MPVPLLMIAILVAGGASAESQSLAEVAAKEKERRAKAGGSAKSYTDADLRDAASKRAREGSVAPTRIDPSPAQSTAADSSEPADSSASDAAKRARGAEYKTSLDATNADLKRAEEDLRAAEKDWNFVNSHPWELAGWFNNVRSRFESAKKRVELLRRERDDIEDAARHEGIPPGYLR